MTRIRRPVLELNIRQGHIDEGVRGCPYKSAMALALEDAVHKWGNCWVGFRIARVTIPGWCTMFATLPMKARQWNSAFDDGVPVEPTTFTLEFTEREWGD